METDSDYDPRYLAGIQLFNARDFFEAHEVWEDLWAASAQPDRRFYQALIQCAVALFHFGNGNIRGAVRLYHSALNYHKPTFPQHQGLDLTAFWGQMEACFARVLAEPDKAGAERPDAALIPTIVLDPLPGEWPDPEQFLPDDE